MELPQVYDPTKTFDNTNLLYSNHFRFALERLPDLSFFAQAITTPTVSAGVATMVTPFSNIHQPGDRLTYGQFQVTYLVDARFKTYFSLYYWMKGFGFPNSYDEVVNFRANQLERIGNPRATPQDIEKTQAILTVVTPDTSAAVAEFVVKDVFPVDLSGINFTTEGESIQLTTTCTFSCAGFDLRTYV